MLTPSKKIASVETELRFTSESSEAMLKKIGKDGYVTPADSIMFCLTLAEEYLEFCSNYRLEHGREGCETEVPSFCQFLDGRGYTDLSNLLRESFESRQEGRPSDSESDGNTEAGR